MSIKSPPRPGSRITKVEPTNPAIASTASASTGAALAASPRAHGILDGKEAYADFAEQCHALRYRGFRIHGLGEGDPREETENLLHCASRVGSRMALMYDAASELKTLADAIHVGRACDEARCVTVALATPPPKIGALLRCDEQGERG